MKAKFLFNENAISNSFKVEFDRKTPNDLHKSIMNFGGATWNLSTGYSIPDSKKDKFIQALSEYIDTECLACEHQWLLEAGEVSCPTCGSNHLAGMAETVLNETIA